MGVNARVQARPVVLAWRDGAAAPARALWERLDGLGWLPADPGRIVIQLGQGCRSPLAVETVRSLAGFLRERTLSAPIQILDQAAEADAWAAFDPYDVTAVEPLCVSAVAAKRGLRVPAFWFEPSFLITVAAAHPDAVTRLAGVLDAQADPLRRLRNRYTSGVLAYEAHRLAASDLSIACGTASWNDPASEHWWAVSASDVAVDQAVAAAAGVDATELPVLRGFARHELIGASVEPAGTLPRLRGYVAPRLVASVHAARSRLGASGLAVAHDAALVRHNLHKIPNFVRRRLAARKGGAA
jgi:hypothetical protein